ncbi:hypothetical protein F2Q70_00039590 [Brassica cretica]|uniref:Uncharacterized protein n=1 Tax=Brassica cretica TaxID=69181 RepID=A0A8S9KA38_BRACR|nr:hypothetical protein F2Q70_00039590 [Brassica cretica]
MMMMSSRSNRSGMNEIRRRQSLMLEKPPTVNMLISLFRFTQNWLVNCVAVVYSTPSSPAFLLLLIVSGGVVGEFGPGSSPVPLRPLLLFAFFGLTDSRSENQIGLSSPQLGSCIFALLLILKDVWVSSIGESDSLD